MSEIRRQQSERGRSLMKTNEAFIEQQDSLPIDFPMANGGPHCRVSSPLGGSILMTSAPRLASVIVQRGLLSTRVRSMTRIPWSGCMRDLLHFTVQAALDAGYLPVNTGMRFSR